MKVCLLGPATYAGKFQFGQWPVASEQCDPETAARSYAAQLELFEHAEALGFDLDIAFAPDAYGRGADATKEALTAFGEVLTDVQEL